MHKLDHIVFAAPTLEEGTSFIENKLQVKLGNIGYHEEMGTHNRVVKISESVYLEVISIDPKSITRKSKRWFNLDCPKLQSKLKKSPQVIGYVIESDNKKILKYYEPFFRASRGEYKWQFSMPSTKSNNLVDRSYQDGIMPSLINWESVKPINKMKNTHLDLQKLEIVFIESQLPLRSFINSLGTIEKLKLSSINQDKLFIEDYPRLIINIKDKKRDKDITL